MNANNLEIALVIDILSLDGGVDFELTVRILTVSFTLLVNQVRVQE